MGDGHRRLYRDGTSAPADTRRANLAGTDREPGDLPHGRFASPRGGGMIRGTVNSHREAIISIIVLDANGQPHALDAVIDTGFNGSLTLPSATIAALGLLWRNRGNTVLANGMVEDCDIYTGVILWDSQPRNILVESAETDPLVGMQLMSGYR